MLRARRPLQLAARSAILVAVSPVLFVASGIHGDPVGVAVALASRVEPIVLLVLGPRRQLAADRLGRHPPPDRHHRAPPGILD